MAEAAGLPVVTHTFGELGVATAAVLQLHAAHPNFILDNQTYYWNLEDDVICRRRPAALRRALPSGAAGPGIGVDLDRDRVAHYAAYYVREVEGRGPPKIRTTPATTSCVLAHEVPGRLRSDGRAAGQA